MKKLLLAIMMCVMSVSAAPVLLCGDGALKNRIRIIIVGDGFTASEQGAFNTFAGSLFASLKSEPYFEKYQGVMNVYAAFTPSTQSGADHPLQNSWVETAFDGSFGYTESLERLVTVDQFKVASFLLTQFENYDPNYDITLAVVNDAEYGGSGGDIAVATMHYWGKLVSLHEIGHSFGKLTDEYDYQVEYEPGEFPNSTAQKSRSAIKWKAWIDAATPVPTPETAEYDAKCGLFEGACYRPTGWYRPWNNCMMKSLDFKFCPICNDELVTVSYKQISPIDAALPAEGSTVNAASQATLSVKLLPLQQKPLVTWYVNGKLIAVQGEVLNLSLAGLLIGTNTVKAIVKDNGGFVKIPSHQSFLSDTAVWTVTFAGDPAKPNLALNKSATSLSFQSTNSAAKGCDGSASTRWAAANSLYPTWWRVDLGSVLAITGTKVNFYAARNYRYKIEVSNDDLNYVTAVDNSTTTLATQVRTDNFTASGRYVRITYTAGSGYASHWEFEVYGAVGPVSYPLTASAVNGTVSRSPSGSSYPAGTVVILTAVPQSGYVFSRWSGDLSGVVNPATVTMNGAKSITAEFVVAPASSNIALNKPAANSSYSGSYTANKGCDGSASSRWAAVNSSYPAWWSVDLGSVQTITGTKVDFYAARNYRYRIEVSNDGITYTTAVDNSSTTLATQVRTDNFNASCRYVRIMYTAGTGYASHWEFEVFGALPKGPSESPVAQLAQSREPGLTMAGRNSVVISGAAGTPYMIITMAGRTVARGVLPASQEAVVDMGTFTRGLYFVKISANGKRVLQKVMVR